MYGKRNRFSWYHKILYEASGWGGGAYFFQARLRGAKRERGLFNLVKCVNRSKVLEDGFVVIGCYTAFSNNKKMATILHRELEHKVEKVKHMKLEVM